MNNKVEEFRTPGQLIKALLEDRGWTQDVLSVVLGISQSAVARLATDRTPIDAERAIALSEAFSVPPQRFLNLQKEYDLERARIESPPDPRRAIRAQLYSDLPIREMAKRGWISVDNVRDAKKVEQELSTFFGVGDAEDIEILPHATRKTAVAEGVTPTQLAWLYRVRAIAKDMIVPAYSELGMRRALKELHNLLIAPEEARHAPRILAEAGVRFVVVETIGSARIDGVCFWLDELSPVVGMSMRFDRIDNFWFVLRHELEHVRLGHGRDVVAIDAGLDEDGGDIEADVHDEERIANEAASNFCVPQSVLQQFIDRKAPLFPERDLLGFSKIIGVHPGLVAGQIRRRTGRYELFHRHLAKVRSIVTPSAMTDGWGDVAPIGA
jgi:HTH-type transcriptional regulator/antitoxin HigA